jgi:hypothetical protein
VSLSRQTKIIALAGLALLLGIAGLGSFVLARQKVAAQPVVVTHHDAKPVQEARTHGSRPRIDAALPATLRAALARSATVVAVLDAPGIAGDAGAVKAARTGAKAAHVGFAVLNVRNEATAAALAQQAPGATDPAVLVVRRPGTIAVELDGYADSETVAQAAVDARS